LSVAFLLVVRDCAAGESTLEQLRQACGGREAALKTFAVKGTITGTNLAVENSGSSRTEQWTIAGKRAGEDVLSQRDRPFRRWRASVPPGAPPLSLGTAAANEPVGDTLTEAHYSGFDRTTTTAIQTVGGERGWRADDLLGRDPVEGFSCQPQTP
jgi:hypothetical protein